MLMLKGKFVYVHTNEEKIYATIDMHTNERLRYITLEFTGIIPKIKPNFDYIQKYKVIETFLRERLKEIDILYIGSKDTNSNILLEKTIINGEFHSITNNTDKILLNLSFINSTTFLPHIFSINISEIIDDRSTKNIKSLNTICRKEAKNHEIELYSYILKE